MSNVTISKIIEGETEVFVYQHNLHTKGPAAKSGIPFYNPSMELNRDSSLLIAQWLLNNSIRPVHFLDGLAASGIRGIRFENELNGSFSVVANDWNKKAYTLIKKNIRYSDSKQVIGVQKNLHQLFDEQQYNYIDIDPFGSPIEFFDGAMRSITHKGILACTATDTAALCGVYPQVCLRRYGALSLHGFLMQEIGLRILLGVLCREATKYNKGIRPLWSFSTDHFFRIYLQILNGKRYANKSIKQYQIISTHDDLPFPKLFPKKLVGPLWLGPLHEKTGVIDCQHILLKKKLGTKGQLLNLLEICIQEAELPAFFYSTDAAARLYKQSPKPIRIIFNELLENGYRVSPCSLSSTGFRTNAPSDKVEEILKAK